MLKKLGDEEGCVAINGLCTVNFVFSTIPTMSCDRLGLLRPVGSLSCDGKEGGAPTVHKVFGLGNLKALFSFYFILHKIQDNSHPNRL